MPEFLQFALIVGAYVTVMGLIFWGGMRVARSNARQHGWTLPREPYVTPGLYEAAKEAGMLRLRYHEVGGGLSVEETARMHELEDKVDRLMVRDA
jgi:hypothetical protein